MEPKYRKKLDAFEEKLLNCKEVAVCCSDSRLGKDWFLLKLSKQYPFYECEDLEIEIIDKYVAIIKKLINEKKLERALLNQYGSVYHITGKDFKKAFQENKNKFTRKNEEHRNN